MLKTRTFPKGGVHPPGEKTLAKSVPIQTLPVPETVAVPLSQHLGAPAKVNVAKGDAVVRGQKIGTGESFISADIHAPVSGVVTDIMKITLANSIDTEAVIIRTSPEETIAVKFPVSGADPVAGRSVRELLDAVKSAGIVGMGGAAFPAHVKFQIPKGKRAEVLVINGVECEPYLTADHRLMLEHTQEIIDGIRVIQKIISADRVVIGIESNKMDAVEAFEQAIAQRGLGYTVRTLKVKYPQGDEKQLLKAVIGREVPSGGLPIEIGAVASNAGTAYAIYEAVWAGKPLIERVVTVTGDAVKNPGNFRVPVGISIRKLIEAAGGFRKEPAKIVAGGPMMGFAFFDLETPVTKGTSGILALTDRVLDHAVETPCISCGTCVSVCPMGLQPTRMYRLISSGRYGDAMNNNLMDCKECGCCAYSCPAKIPLVHGFKFGKKMARKTS